MHGSLSSVDNIRVSGESSPILDELAETFIVAEPDRLRTPLVFASPHSGRSYPAAFLEACAAPLIDLRRIEDAYVDLLFAGVAHFGAPLIHAQIGRACIDLNRAPTELDVAMFCEPLDAAPVSRTPRVSAGLGCIPRIAHGGKAIYRGKLPAADAYERLERIYHPYHRALDALLDKSHAAFASAILIDCHSMPSTTETGAPLPDIVLGDRFGAACSPALTRMVEQGLTRRGYTVARNSPYAGGHITSSRGRPDKGRHALQVEINRRLYLDEENVEPIKGLDKLRLDLEGCFQDVARWSLDFARRLR